ncbi:hypothetical protein NC653_009533 [Populus alba x Populus x berolinensis]|uniref:Uncharacterized protein n=1 Tax=Populus alba x Populus x berolinensis TaxID=444605 RepID=A0AAD6W9Z4_9ROSI|nr:hypothetical protein NC653_009533 [Populus alba x Populus x berolinensis]
MGLCVFCCDCIVVSWCRGYFKTDVVGISALTRNVEAEKEQSSSNSTMAARSQEEADAFNEKAVAADPEEVVSMVEMNIRNSTERRRLGYFSCGTGNPIDDCWRCDPNWHKNRKRLADCGIGFGRNAIGGRDGRFYVVTDSSDHDPVNPRAWNFAPCRDPGRSSMDRVQKGHGDSIEAGTYHEQL